MRVIYEINRENYGHRNEKLIRNLKEYRRRKNRRMRYELYRKYRKNISKNRNFECNKVIKLRRKIGDKIYIYQVNYSSNEE